MKPDVNNVIAQARALPPSEQMALLAGIGCTSRPLKSGATKFSVVIKPRRIDAGAVRRVKRMRRDYFPHHSQS